jgi:hypothetical protein
VRRTLWAAVAALATVSLSGCHTYLRTDLRAVPPGQEVRVYLSRAGIIALPEDVQPVNNLYLAGRLESQDADSLMLGVRVGSRDPGVISQDLRQLVKVGAGQVVDVQLRQFSAPRTALTVAGAALGVTLIVGMIFEAVTSEDVGDPNEDLSRVPVLSLPFRLPF